jgi:hypothetical protein
VVEAVTYVAKGSEVVKLVWFDINEAVCGVDAVNIPFDDVKIGVGDGVRGEVFERVRTGAHERMYLVSLGDKQLSKV